MTVHSPIQAQSGHQPYRFTERDYMLLSENGAFDEYAKTELIEGVIYAVNAQFSRHIRVQSRLHQALANACDEIEGDIAAWVEGSLSIDGGSTPRPDIFVSRALPEEGVVPLASVLLVVEVADSSLDQDLGLKAQLYARAGLPEYWVADVNGRVIHQMWSPSGSSYLRSGKVSFGDVLTAATVDKLTISTDRL